jgi:hypothetical protein
VCVCVCVCVRARAWLNFKGCTCQVRGDALSFRRDGIQLWLHETRTVVCDALMVPADEVLCQRHIAAVAARCVCVHACVRACIYVCVLVS